MATSILDAIVNGAPDFRPCNCGTRRLATVICACNRSSCSKCATHKHAEAACVPVQVRTVLAAFSLHCSLPSLHAHGRQSQPPITRARPPRLQFRLYMYRPSIAVHDVLSSTLSDLLVGVAIYHANGVPVVFVHPQREKGGRGAQPTPNPKLHATCPCKRHVRSTAKYCSLACAMFLKIKKVPRKQANPRPAFLF